MAFPLPAKVLSVLAVVLAGAAAADQTGRAEYESLCLACHGDGGKGDGPLSDFLNVKVPPLTGLSAANEGEFPLLEVVMVIDGRNGIRAHGGAMPIWGDRFRAMHAEAAPYGDEVLARGLILSLAYYLESIQE